MLRVRINGLTFDGDGPRTGKGYLITPDGFSGWDDGVGIRRQETLLPVGHGAFDEPGYLSPRVISISGQILADTPVRLAKMRQALTGLLADGGTGRVVVDQDDVNTWADARLAAQTMVKQNSSDLSSASFQVQLWCHNPRKFGEVQVAGPGTSVTAFHYGNFRASPELLVTGVMPSGYRVNGPDGRQFVVSQALAAGQTHRIDMSTGWLYRNGVLQTGAVSSARIWTVPSGVRVTHTLVPVSGSGQLTVRTPDTYI